MNKRTLLKLLVLPTAGTVASFLTGTHFLRKYQQERKRLAALFQRAQTAGGDHGQRAIRG